MGKRFLVLFLLISSYGFSQKAYKIRTVGFYNLENLFDTINDTSKKDELSPMMHIKSDRSQVYYEKLEKLSEVISQIGKQKTKNSPVLLGVAEIENRVVLEDLIKTKKLRNSHYDIIHFDSPDHRGIDVALLYQPKYFTPTHSEVFNPNIYVDSMKIDTRDILWVKGFLDNEEINVIVNHWPSRRGGKVKTSPQREKAAYKVNQVIEKIRANDEDAKIIIMGDFNDDPTDKSLKKGLKTIADKEDLQEEDIYNPYENMFAQGHNTLTYRDKINLFDQILISEPLVNMHQENDFSAYKMFKSAIFNKRFLTQKRGRFKGYPYRSFVKNQFTGGYSDHYPVYMYLIKEN